MGTPLHRGATGARWIPHWHECPGGGIEVEQMLDATFDHPLYFPDKGWVIKVGVW
jgi:hypothetical protein